MQKFPNALRASWLLLRTLMGLNLAMGVFILAMLVASLTAGRPVMHAMGIHPLSSDRGVIFGMRVIMVLGLTAIPLTHRLLARLLAIVETVRDGDPFVSQNAVRLQKIAWTSLVLEVLHWVIGGIAASASTPDAVLDINWSFSPSGVVAILLFFVLARVFEHGTRMREDLEGTV
jgi:hypothetical protein